MTFFYSFIETMLHSIWQAASLLCIYLIVNKIEKNFHPLQKRNFLYLLLLSQFCISVVTFLSFFIGFNLIIDIKIPFQNNRFAFINNYCPIIFTLYTGIVVVKILQVIIHWSSFRKNYTQQIIRPNAALKNFMDLHANRLCIKNRVTLWFSNSIKTPVTFGFFKPVILLPISIINNISIEQAELIILHELVHIKSKDYLYNWFLLLMEVIYFFNPFIKTLANNLKLEREKNCDVQVINHQYGILEYADALYKIAHNSFILKSFQLGAFKNNSQLYKRIRYFSEDRNLVYSKSKDLFFLPVFILVTCAICFFSITKKSALQAPLLSSSTSFSYTFSERKSFVIEKLPSSKKMTSTKNKENVLAKIKTTTTTNTVEKSINESQNIDDNNIFTPVVFDETTDSVKEVIYNIETQSGTVTQSYKLIRKNDTWIFIPQWMIVETKDSTSKKISTDSSLIKKVSTIQ